MSEELDIPEVTLYYWDRQLKNGNMGKKQPQSLIDKQDIVFIYQSLTEEDKGIWLRENGFYETDIISWKEELKEALLGIKEFPKKEKELKQEIEQLTKELNQKDKALAEVTALFV